MRFVEKNNDLNIGFDEKEIDTLENTCQIIFPKYYRDFLSKAGKKSNVLLTDFIGIEDLINLQHTFLERIENSDLEPMHGSMWCFAVKDLRYYYFFRISDKKDPLVFCFSDVGYLVDNGWNHKLGSYERKTNFVNFIKWKTDSKWGQVFWEKIRGYLLLILISPILLFFLPYRKIGQNITRVFSKKKI